MYEYFDKTYADSKFILISREPDEWLKSIKNLFNKDGIDPVSHACYKEYIPNIKDITENKEIGVSDQDLLYMYNRHNSLVKEYFKGRDNFLELGIDDLQKTEKISLFLNINLPNKIKNIDYIRTI